MPIPPTPFHKIYHYVWYKVAVCTRQLSGQILHTPPISYLPKYYSVIVTKEIPVYDPNTLIYVLQSQVSVYPGIQTLLTRQRSSKYCTKGLHHKIIKRKNGK
jgi:hypothetical protein